MCVCVYIYTLYRATQNPKFHTISWILAIFAEFSKQKKGEKVEEICSIFMEFGHLKTKKNFKT